MTPFVIACAASWVSSRIEDRAMMYLEFLILIVVELRVVSILCGFVGDLPL